MTSASLWPRGSTTADFFPAAPDYRSVAQFRQQIIAAPVPAEHKYRRPSAYGRRVGSGSENGRLRILQQAMSAKMRASIYSPEKPNLSAQSAVVFSATGHKRRQTLPYARAGLPLSPAADFQNPRAPADFSSRRRTKDKAMAATLPGGT